MGITFKSKSRFLRRNRRLKLRRHWSENGLRRAHRFAVRSGASIFGTAFAKTVRKRCFWQKRNYLFSSVSKPLSKPGIPTNVRRSLLCRYKKPMRTTCNGWKNNYPHRRTVNSLIPDRNRRRIQNPGNQRLFNFPLLVRNNRLRNNPMRKYRNRQRFDIVRNHKIPVFN